MNVAVIGGGTSSEAPPSSTIVFLESFDGSSSCADGYSSTCDKTWAATTGTGCSLDFDNAEQKQGGSYSLKAVSATSGFEAYAGHDFASTIAVSYSRIYLYISSEGLADGQAQVIAATVSYTSWDNPWRIDLVQTGADLYLRLNYYSGGASTNLDLSTGTVSTGQWYNVEVKYDVTGAAWDWRIGGVSQGSGSLSGTVYGLDNFRVGPYVDSYAATIYYDSISIASDMWVGN